MITITEDSQYNEAVTDINEKILMKYKAEGTIVEKIKDLKNSLNSQLKKVTEKLSQVREHLEEVKAIKDY